MIQKRWTMTATMLSLMLALSSCASSQHETTAGDFGGQPKDQEARERHHPQYPENAQHLGPQVDQSAKDAEAHRSSEQSDQERAAVSGVGK